MLNIDERCAYEYDYIVKLVQNGEKQVTCKINNSKIICISMLAPDMVFDGILRINSINLCIQDEIGRVDFVLKSLKIR